MSDQILSNEAAIQSSMARIGAIKGRLGEGYDTITRSLQVLSVDGQGAAAEAMGDISRNQAKVNQSVNELLSTIQQITTRFGQDITDFDRQASARLR